MQSIVKKVMKNPLAVAPDDLSVAFLQAARNIDGDGLKRYIEEGVSVNCRELQQGNSAIHLILALGCYSDDCLTNQVETCLKILLEKGANPNSENFVGRTPLDLIVDRGAPTSTAKILIRYGATLIKGNGIANPALWKKIALKQPQVAAALLDTAISFDPEKTIITNDFRTDAVRLDWRYLTYNSNSSKGIVETKFLNDVLHGSAETRRIILTHPLVKAFLVFKRPLYWKHFGAFHCIWILLTLLLYMVFVWLVYNDTCKFPSTSNKTENGATRANWGFGTTGTKCSLPIWLSALGGATIILFLLGPAIIEWRKLWAMGPSVYLKQWQHYLNLLMLSCVLFTLYPACTFIFEDNVFYLSWEYGVAAMGMLVGSLSILIQMTAIPFVALYLEMIFKIFWKICIASFAMSPLLIGFFLSFQILMPTHAIGPFDLLTMIVSDTEYNSLVELDRNTIIIAATYISFTAFIFLVVIVLLNFLIGLAVNDIKELTSSAKATNLANQVRSYYLMDTVYGFRKKNNRAVTKGGKRMSYVFYPLGDTGRRTFLPEDIKLELLQIARGRCFHPTILETNNNTSPDNMDKVNPHGYTLHRSPRWNHAKEPIVVMETIETLA